MTGVGKATAAAAPAIDLADAKASKVMLWIIVVSTVLFSWLAYLQYANFTSEANDLTIVSYAFAHTVQGQFFPLPFAEGSLMGNHPNLIYLLIFPFYYLVRTVPFLLFVQSLFISASAWPLFLLAKRKLGDNFSAVCIATAYLLFPPVVSQHLNQIHDDQFANISILFAAYFFEREHFRNFSLAIVLACLTKETVALTAAMFGVWAIFCRRSWKWMAFPLVIGFGYFFVGVKMLMTLFPGQGASLYANTRYLDLYGKSPAEVLHTLMTRPGFVLANTFSQDKIGYLFKLLGPILWALPFCSLAIVLSAPNLAINLISTNSAMIVIPWHYGVVLGATLFIALVYSLPKAVAWLRSRYGVQDYVKAMTASILLLNLTAYPLWLDTNKFRKPPEYDTLVRVLESIPRTAAVICPSPMLAHFSNFPKATTAYSVVKDQGGPEHTAVYDIVILDANWQNMEALAQRPVFEWIQKSQLYDLTLNENNVLVFQKRTQPLSIVPARP